MSRVANKFIDTDTRHFRFNAIPAPKQKAGLAECKATHKPGPCKRKVSKISSAVHPFAGKSREEIVQDISRYSVHSGATADPWGLGSFDASPHQAMQTSIASTVAAHANSFSRPTINDVWDKVKSAHPDTTLHDFQGTLVQMHKAGKIELGPFTQAPVTIPHPEFVIPFGFNRYYYVGRGTRGALGECKDEAIDLPDIRQSDDFSCGAACVASVLGAANINVSPDSLKPLLGTTRRGTDPEPMAELCQQLGLDVKAGPMELQELADHIAVGRPVICAVQDTNPEEYEDGHYVVVTGFIGEPSVPVEECGGEGGKPGPCPEPGGEKNKPEKSSTGVDRRDVAVKMSAMKKLTDLYADMPALEKNVPGIGAIAKAHEAGAAARVDDLAVQYPRAGLFLNAEQHHYDGTDPQIKDAALKALNILARGGNATEAANAIKRPLLTKLEAADLDVLHHGNAKAKAQAFTIRGKLERIDVHLERIAERSRQERKAKHAAEK